jgi:hypothetical protein
MSETYVAVAYCPNTGLALTSEDKGSSFYMDPYGNVKPMFKDFPASAVLKHHYMELRPIKGNVTRMLELFNKLEAQLGDLEDIDG